MSDTGPARKYHALIAELMDVHNPITDREWAALQEMERLAAEVEKLRQERNEIIEQCARACAYRADIHLSAYGLGGERSAEATACAAAIRALKEER
jgi:hypothetical protein